jgi:hypothetical protein
VANVSGARIALGALLASLLAGPTFLVVGLIATELQYGRDSNSVQPVMTFPSYVISGVMVAFPTLLALGQPVTSLLRRKGLLQWYYFLGMGALIGGTVAFLLHPVFLLGSNLMFADVLRIPGFGGVLPGALVGLVWRLVVIPNARV